MGGQAGEGPQHSLFIQVNVPCNSACLSTMLSDTRPGDIFLSSTSSREEKKRKVEAVYGLEAQVLRVRFWNSLKRNNLLTYFLIFVGNNSLHGVIFHWDGGLTCTTTRCPKVFGTIFSLKEICNFLRRVIQVRFSCDVSRHCSLQ